MPNPFIRTAFSLLLGLTLFTLLFSQTTQPVDPLHASIKSLLKEQKNDEVITLVEPLCEKFSDEKNWERYADYCGFLVTAVHQKTEYGRALIIAQKALANIQGAGKGRDLVAAHLKVWEALEYNKLEQFDKCLNSYDDAIRIFELNRVKCPKLAFSYKNAAQIYLRYSNDKKAIKYLEYALVSDSSKVKSQDASVFAQLTSLYIELDSMPLAEHYYALGRAQSKINPLYKATLDFSGAVLALKTGNPELAKFNILEALRYYKDDPTEGANRIRSFTVLADIAVFQQKMPLAEHCFQLAEIEGREYYSAKSREMAKLYVETGLFYESNQQPDRALACYQKALVQAFPNFNSLNTGDNPALTEAGLESQAMRAAGAKAQLLLKRAETGKESRSLRENAAHCFNLSFAVAARLRHFYGNDADKLALSANNRQACQSAALNLWQLWSDTRETQYLEHLFSLMEETKAQALADAIQQQRALILSGIPDSLLQQEAVLRLEAAHASKAGDGAVILSDSVIQLRQQEAFRRTRDYEAFIDRLGKTYPQFRQYIESDGTTGIAAIRQALPDSTMLLSWFDAGDRYLCLRLQGAGIAASEVWRDTASDQALRSFIELLSDLNLQQTTPAAYFTAAHALYQSLLPAVNFDGVKSLLIVPDGLLCYLPFEVLLTAPHPAGGYANAPYLLKNCAVSYAWSANLLTDQATGPEQHGFTQFAPFVNAGRGQWARLESSLADVPQEVQVTVVEGKAATSDNFLQQAPDHNVLHLSTHAHAGDDGVPGIEFFDRTLTVSEIYAQRFKASLVTLSACETGSGKFAGGEGVISLARAFAYAGAKSMVASLWSVNDRATSTLFSGFYQNLKQGMPKSEALRQTKLARLAADESDIYKAPYYWAAFTLTGIDGPVAIYNRWTGLWRWGGLALILSMLVFWGFRKRKKQQH